MPHFTDAFTNLMHKTVRDSGETYRKYTKYKDNKQEQ